MARDRIELASLDAFVRAHYPRLVRLAGLISRDTDQAQDAVQSALERAWLKRGDVRDAASLRPWLDRIVAREAIRQTRAGGLANLWRREPPDWTLYPANLPEPAEIVALRAALSRLSPNHRAVIALHLYAGYSIDETARVLEVPFDTEQAVQVLPAHSVLGCGGGDGQPLCDDLDDGHPMLRHAPDCHACPDSPVACQVSPMS